MMRSLPEPSVTSYALRSRRSRTMRSVAALARGSAKACFASGRRSSAPTYAPMKLGTNGSERLGYIRQKPVSLMKLRACSMVSTALPSSRQLWFRCCCRSCSVIASDSLKRLLYLLNRIPQHYGTSMRTAHGALGFREFLQQPLHLVLFQWHVDLDGRMAGNAGCDPCPNLLQIQRLLFMFKLLQQLEQHLFDVACFN